MNEKEKYQYWYDKGVKRGIPYSIEELILKYKRNSTVIKYTFLGMLGVMGFLVWLIYFWENTTLRLIGK